MYVIIRDDSLYLFLPLSYICSTLFGILYIKSESKIVVNAWLRSTGINNENAFVYSKQ